MKVEPVRAASARLRFHCSTCWALSKEMITYCVGGLAGSARAAKAAKKAHVERRAAARTANDIWTKDPDELEIRASGQMWRRLERAAHRLWQAGNCHKV